MDVWNFEIGITLKRSHGNNGWSLCFSLRTVEKMCVIIKWFKLDLVTSSVKQNNGKECLLYRGFYVSCSITTGQLRINIGSRFSCSLRFTTYFVLLLLISSDCL